MEIRSFIFLLLISLIPKAAVSRRRPSSGAGPFRVVFRRMTNVSEDFTSTGEYWSKIYSTPFKQGQPQYVWGRTDNSFEFNDQVKVDIRMAIWERNRWKKGSFALTFEKGCTDFLRQAKAVMMLLHGDDGARCPVRPASRTIRNQTLNLQFPQFPIFPYGRWLQTMRLIKNSQTVGIVVTEVETIPR